MKKYLLNVTFYAGSDEPEDIDRGLYVLSVEEDISEEKIIKIFRKVNKLLDWYDDETENRKFPISYEEGLNIWTLMRGVEFYVKGKVEALTNSSFSINHYTGFLNFDNYYEIEQWQ